MLSTFGFGVISILLAVSSQGPVNRDAVLRINLCDVSPNADGFLGVVVPAKTPSEIVIDVPTLTRRSLPNYRRFSRIELVSIDSEGRRKVVSTISGSHVALRRYFPAAAVEAQLFLAVTTDQNAPLARSVGCPSDYNNDGLVDDNDFSHFVECYENYYDCESSCDLNGDCVVDDSDFALFIAAYDDFICP